MHFVTQQILHVDFEVHESCKYKLCCFVDLCYVLSHTRISSINPNSLIIRSPDFPTKLFILLPLNNSIKFEQFRFGPNRVRSL